MSGMIAKDKDGFPIMMANVPGSGVSKTDPNAASGNPRHDTRSGKFGDGSGSKDPRAQVPGHSPVAPDNVDPLQWKRMLDAVRDAAREFDLPGEGDVRDFLQGRAKSPGQVDIPAFLEMVKEQRLNDLVDIIDQQIRQGGLLPTARRRVKLNAPRGFVKRAFAQLDEAGVAELMHRLEFKGHAQADIERFVLGRLKNDKQKQAVHDVKKTIAASDDLPWPELDPDVPGVAFTELLEKIPAPTVNVTPEIHVHMPDEKRVKRVPIRDKNGLIEAVVEEEA